MMGGPGMGMMTGPRMMMRHGMMGSWYGNGGFPRIMHGPK